VPDLEMGNKDIIPVKKESLEYLFAQITNLNGKLL
jgi:hypothetical protein